MKAAYIFNEPISTYQNYLTKTVVGVRAAIELEEFILKERQSHEQNSKSPLKSFLQKRSKNKRRSEILKQLQKFDLVHLQHSYLFRFLSKLRDWPQAERPRIVITLRGGDTYVKPWRNKAWHEFYKESAQWVDAFVVMSEHQKEYLTRWGVPDSIIHVIPISYGYEFKTGPKVPHSETLRLVSVFRMCWEKNIVGHLKLARELKKSGIPFKYDFYGDGPDMRQLLFLTDQYDLTDVVEIKGEADNDEVRDGLQNYDYLVQLSHSESLGMSVIEAQAKGLPVIVSKNGGLPEAILQSETGWAFDPDDYGEIIKTISTIWKDKIRYKEASKKAIDFVKENFNSDREVKQLLRLYRNLLDA